MVGPDWVDTPLQKAGPTAERYLNVSDRFKMFTRAETFLTRRPSET